MASRPTFNLTPKAWYTGLSQTSCRYLFLHIPISRVCMPGTFKGFYATVLSWSMGIHLISTISGTSIVSRGSMMLIIRQRCRVRVGTLSWNLFRLKSSSVSTLNHPHEPDYRLHEGTLRDFYRLTSTLSNEECPPINALLLPSR